MTQRKSFNASGIFNWKLPFLLSILFWMSLPNAFADTSTAKTHTVKGVVLDISKDPIIGATVMEKGTNNGVMTDVDGAFSLNTAPNATLEVSYVGFTTQSIPVNG